MLCVPTTPTYYTVDAVRQDPSRTNANLGTYTNFVNLLDLCGTAVPSGTRSDGLPASVTLIAPAGHDALAATLAGELHATLRPFNWRDRVAPAESPPLPTAPADRIPLVVVGAHLSGMPLNGEFIAAGGRFDRAVATTPDTGSTLLAQPGTPKPGLVRRPSMASP